MSKPIVVMFIPDSSSSFKWSFHPSLWHITMVDGKGRWFCANRSGERRPPACIPAYFLFSWSACAERSPPGTRKRRGATPGRSTPSCAPVAMAPSSRVERAAAYAATRGVPGAALDAVDRGERNRILCGRQIPEMETSALPRHAHHSETAAARDR